jgi:hypothetical protein
MINISKPWTLELFDSFSERSENLPKEVPRISLRRKRIYSQQHESSILVYKVNFNLTRIKKETKEVKYYSIADQTPAKKSVEKYKR